MRAFLVAGVLMFSVGLTHAQYSARRLTGRILPNQGYAPGAAPAPPLPTRAAPAPPAARQAPARPAPVPRAAAPGPNGTAGRMVAVVPEETEQAKADRAEAEKKTVEFQIKRAHEGQPSAQYELGMRYLTGKGVPKDEKEGRKWLKTAAEKGNSQAKKKLAELAKNDELGIHVETHAAAANEAPKAKQQN